MKQNRLIILVATILILAMVGFMAYDFFSEDKQAKNIYEFNIDDYKNVNPQLISHTEILQIIPKNKNLHGICVDINDNIYAVGDSVIDIFDPSGIFLREIKTNSNGLCITVDEMQNIYIGATDHIEIWNPDGELISSWNPVSDKSILTSIAIEDTNVFAADAGNKILYRYNTKGNLINQIGKKDSLNGIQGFVIPSPYFDIAIGRDNEVWAVNSGRHQLESYKPNGSLISSWKKTSMGLDGFSGCCNPSHIAMLSDGSFVTSEKGLVRIKIHKPSGEFTSVVAASDKFEKGTRGLDLAVDSKDRVIVLDPKKGIIRIFQSKTK